MYPCTYLISSSWVGKRGPQTLLLREVPILMYVPSPPYIPWGLCLRDARAGKPGGRANIPSLNLG